MGKILVSLITLMLVSFLYASYIKPHTKFNPNNINQIQNYKVNVCFPCLVEDIYYEQEDYQNYINNSKNILKIKTKNQSIDGSYLVTDVEILDIYKNDENFKKGDSLKLIESLTIENNLDSYDIFLNASNFPLKIDEEYIVNIKKSDIFIDYYTFHLNAFGAYSLKENKIVFNKKFDNYDEVSSNYYIIEIKNINDDEAAKALVDIENLQDLENLYNKIQKDYLKYLKDNFNIDIKIINN